jgi:hypothetical protein
MILFNLLKEERFFAIFSVFFLTLSVIKSQSGDIPGDFHSRNLTLRSWRQIPSGIPFGHEFFVFTHGRAETLNLMDQIFYF